ncbi:hypothetical protein OUZ56_026806 [Daphnia magna]|uniref:Uncharacterized protein n=1 Tax=Daphnia magna TaxID=35525 RepID=A0ABQ9ZP83_9CRUS|nr:hypothetical protein OUZ56_026806 [Daphnia magna]
MCFSDSKDHTIWPVRVILYCCFHRVYPIRVCTLLWARSSIDYVITSSVSFWEKESLSQWHVNKFKDSIKTLLRCTVPQKIPKWFVSCAFTAV